MMPGGQGSRQARPPSAPCRGPVASLRVAVSVLASGPSFAPRSQARQERAGVRVLAFAWQREAIFTKEALPMISANIDRETRKAVYRRDGFQCALCSSTRYLQIHHAIPRGDGGSQDDPMNLITLCARCHSAVHGLDLDEIGVTPEEISQEIVVYLADYYAPSWWPWRSGYHPGGWNPKAGGG